MEKSTQVSIIIVNFNTRVLLLSCIESIYAHVKTPFEVIVVDNDSKDDSVKELKKLKKKNLMLIENRDNAGFTRANNQGIKIAKGSFLLLLNSDTLLTEDSVTKCISYLKTHPKTGIISCMLKNADGSLQSTGGYFPTPMRMFMWMSFIDDVPGVRSIYRSFHPPVNYYTQSRELDWVTGAFFLFRRKMVDHVGLLDEDYFMYVEELDFCFRAKSQGWSVHYDAFSSIIHYGQASSSNEFALLSEYKYLYLFYKKHFPGWIAYSRVMLKTGALARSTIFGILGKKIQQRIYEKAFNTI